MKFGGMSALTASTLQAAKEAGTLKGKRLAMVIDLQRCTGCGGCMISCKSENNVQDGFAWSSRIKKTVGKFPNVRYEFMPTLCNHCENAPCVKACPTSAMHIAEGEIVMHNPEICIGCKTCKAACPYGVIFYNRKKPKAEWRSQKAVIEGCTASPEEMSNKYKDAAFPYYNPGREETTPGSGIRSKGVVEKCTFCDHRLKNGELPFCVDACPAQARVFGDLNDPESEINIILGKYAPYRIKEGLGTEPKVFYVRSFNSGHYDKTKGSI